MSCVWMLQRGHSGDGCVLASTLCKYDLRKGDLFVLSKGATSCCCCLPRPGPSSSQSRFPLSR